MSLSETSDSQDLKRQTSFFKDSFSDLYSNFVLLGELGLIWAFSVILIIPVGPVSAGIYWLVNKIVAGEEATVKELYRGVRKFWLEGLILEVIGLIFLGISLVDFYFYTRIEWFRELQITARTFIIALWFYLTVYFMLTLIYSLPLLVKYQTSAFGALKKSFFLVLYHPIEAVKLWFMTLVSLILSLLFPPVFILFFIGFAAILGLNSTRRLAGKA